MSSSSTVFERSSEAMQQPEPNDFIKSIHYYPGGDATSPSRIFLSLYEEEEAFEEPERPEDYDLNDFDAECVPTGMRLDKTRRTTIYYVLRLFDSIKGFHKGYLDLSGRHPERYYQLQRQWNRFLYGLLGLETEMETESLGDLNSCQWGSVGTRREHWRCFLMKWRLPESTSFSQLISCAQTVLRELKQQPIPLFQMTRLTDLPSELLDNIMGLATTAQAKALANTCHQLNDIGQRHIFRTWLMKLHVPPHVSPLNVEYSNIDLSTLSHYSRIDLEKSAEFILKSPHIARCVKTLMFTDEWWVSRRAYPHENNPFTLGLDFQKSITQVLGSVLRATTNLTTLVLCNMETSMDVIRRVAEVPHLHTLEFHLCHLPPIVRKRLVTDPTFTCPRITNLRIYMDSSFSETHSQWCTILLCSNIRTLSVVQYGVPPFPAPDTHFWVRCRMDNLERLSLENIDSGDLLELMRYLENSSMAVACLTHFKLHMDWGISDAEAITLLLSLQAAPLEVLVLEGLAEAEFPVFERIVDQFPMLHALTLVRRQNPNQHQNKLATWPHASWEYAECFKGFRALRHFCWNFRTEYWDATPSTLLAFESDFSSLPPPPSMMCQHKHLDYDLTDDVPPYFLDSHWMALPFAAYCPTLQSFSLMDRTVDMVCRISHHPMTGAITLTPRYNSGTPSFVSWNVQQWNTTGSNWPSLLPLTKSRSG